MLKGTKSITYDDTRDISIRVIKKLIELGHLEDNDDHYFDIQDTIQDEINDVLGLDIDDNFEVSVTNKCIEDEDLSREELVSKLCSIRKNWVLLDFTEAYSDEWGVIPSTVEECKQRMEEHIHNTYDTEYIKECIEDEKEDLSKAEIVEMLKHYYEIDLDNCTMTHEQWIDEVANALTDENYLNELKKEYEIYLEERK